MAYLLLILEQRGDRDARTQAEGQAAYDSMSRWRDNLRERHDDRDDDDGHDHRERHRAPWIFCLTGRHRYDFVAAVREDQGRIGSTTLCVPPQFEVRLRGE